MASVDRFNIDALELRSLAKDLAAADAAFGSLMRARNKAAAEVVADAARGHASWSTRIPATVRTRASATGSTVSAGGAKAPHAPVFEGTTTGGDRRHPVFARGPRSSWTWVTQPARPFLRPAADDRVDEVTEILGGVVDDIAHLAGFHGE